MRCAFFAVLLSLSVAASAAGWEHLVEHATVSTEFDSASLQTTGKYVEASFRFTYMAAQTNVESHAQYLSAVVQVRFDCEARTFLPYQRVEYSGRRGAGTVVATVMVPEAKRNFQPVTDGSMNGFMFKRACSK